MDAEQWDQRYDQAGLVWSATPNRWVEEVTGALPPGRALDLAAGEGRNALWLAGRGWRATAVDFSSVALDRAARIAADLPSGSGGSFDTVCADLREYSPEAQAYDLVLVVYLQVPKQLRTVALRTAASAVAPGGLLVVVAHDSDNLAHGYGGPPDPAALYSAADVAEDLAGCGLDVLRGEQVVRDVTTDAGPRQALDALVVAKRAAAPDQRTRTAALFDALSDTYDAVGVDFFQPIADRLVELIDLRPGERVADLGCGKGAVLLPAGRAVGPTGSAVGLDLSPAMVATARTRATGEGLVQVEVAVGDAQAPDLPPGTFDALTSSLVLFFLPDPSAALEAWRTVLRPLGRLGVATFGPQDDVWAAIDALFQPYLPPAMLDARASGTRGPFASDAGMEGLVSAAGFGDVRTVVLDLPVRFIDAGHWFAFSQSTNQRAMWAMVPEGERPDLRARAEALLAGSPDPAGGYVLHQQVRYTLGQAPS